MTYPTAARNASIAAAFHAGATAPELAQQWGVSSARIYQIAVRYGGSLSAEELRRRRAAVLRANAKYNNRAKFTDAMQRRRDAGLPIGRPRMFADDLVKREEWLDLSKAMGAAYAREAMGL